MQAWSAGRSLALVVALLPAACGPVIVTEAHLETRRDRFENEVKLGDALAYADAVRDLYRDRIRSQVLLERTAGIVGIVGVVTGAFIGVAGGSSDLALGSALAGGTAYAFAQLNSSDSEQLIYAAGAEAVTCLMKKYEGVRSVDEYEAQLEAAVLGDGGTSLIRLRDSVAGTNHDEANEERAAKAVQVADRALSSGRAALVGIRRAGSLLHRDVDDVQNQVDRALIAADVNLAQFLTSLDQTITRFVPAGANGTGPKPAMPEGAGLAPTGGDPLADIAELERRALALQALADLVLSVTEPSPTPECRFDPSVAADGPVEVVPKAVSVAADDDAVFATRGGRPPYSVDWSGRKPPETIAVKLRDTGTGIVELEVGAEATSAEYAFVVTDVRGTVSEPIRVTVQGASE